MMKLIRVLNIPENRKRLINGPVPGGNFWAAKNGHDMVIWEDTPKVEMELSYALEHALVWMRSVLRDHGEWTEDWTLITEENVSRIPKFERFFWEHYEDKTYGVGVSPFMPEFYVLPFDTARGRKIKIKAEGMKGAHSSDVKFPHLPKKYETTWTWEGVKPIRHMRRFSTKEILDGLNLQEVN